MAIHQNTVDLSVEAIDEFIALASLGLEVQKPDGGCLGYPSTLLLFCVIDALNNHLNFERYAFLVLNDPIFGLALTVDQRELLAVWYRNMLAHNAMIAPGVALTLEEGEPFEWANNEPIKIRVKPLFKLVEAA